MLAGECVWLWLYHGSTIVIVHLEVETVMLLASCFAATRALCDRCLTIEPQKRTRAQHRDLTFSSTSTFSSCFSCCRCRFPSSTPVSKVQQRSFVAWSLTLLAKSPTFSFSSKWCISASCVAWTSVLDSLLLEIYSTTLILVILAVLASAQEPQFETT